MYLLCVNKVEIVDLCVDDVVDERLYEKIRDSVIFVLLQLDNMDKLKFVYVIVILNRELRVI